MLVILLEALVLLVTEYKKQWRHSKHVAIVSFSLISRNSMSKLLDSFIKKEQTLLNNTFVAPFDQHTTRIIVKIDKLNYKFNIKKTTSAGLGYFKPKNATEAVLIGEVEEYLSESFFKTLPSINFILCYETDFGWIAYPYDLHGVAKYGIFGEVLIKNVKDCQRFDIITARYDSVNFWYHEIFSGANIAKVIELRECFQSNFNEAQIKLAKDKILGLKKEEETSFDIILESWKKFLKTSTEEVIKQFLQNSGATLSNYILKGESVEIKWKAPSGKTYYSVIKKDSYDVITAGICLSGEDKKFHLKDLPYLVDFAEKEDGVYLTRREIDFENARDRHIGVID